MRWSLCKCVKVWGVFFVSNQWSSRARAKGSVVCGCVSILSIKCDLSVVWGHIHCANVLFVGGHTFSSWTVFEASG